MRPVLTIVRDPATGFLHVILSKPMQLQEVVGILDCAKMQFYEDQRNGVVVRVQDLPMLRG